MNRRLVRVIDRLCKHVKQIKKNYHIIKSTKVDYKKKIHKTIISNYQV